MDILILKALLPEIFLSISILSHLLFNVFLIKHHQTNFPLTDKEHLSQVAFILLCCLFLLQKVQIEGHFIHQMLYTNQGIIVFKCIVIVLMLFILIPTWRYFIYDKLNFFEFFDLYLLSTFLFLLLLNANDLLVIYLLIEMQSLIFYILANFKRSSAFSTEAGLKYFISGSVFSAFYLLGCSILYGLFGSLNFYNLELLLSLPFNNGLLDLLVSLGVFLVAVLFIFKLAIMPFHFWSPDVYEGSPISSTILLSTVPKIIVFTLLLRWIDAAYYIFIKFDFIFSILGLLSILFGMFFANRQKRFKRFVAYSSISQLGYIILFLSNIRLDTYSGIYFFLFIYLIGSIGLWTFIVLLNKFKLDNSNLQQKEHASLFITNLSNFFSINKFWAGAFLVIFGSMAGIPPFSGFLPKMFVFLSLLEDNKWYLSGILVIITCVVIAYYVNVITTMFMEIKMKYKNFSLNNLGVLHSKNYLDEIDYIICSISVFLLLLIFINPSFVFIFCQYITLFII